MVKSPPIETAPMNPALTVSALNPLPPTSASSPRSPPIMIELSKTSPATSRLASVLPEEIRDSLIDAAVTAPRSSPARMSPLSRALSIVTAPIE